MKKLTLLFSLLLLGFLFQNGFIMPTYGFYVSDEQEQYKVDEKGERIANGEGGLLKENFYLFLDLEKTSAKLYVGENNLTHKDTPLHENLRLHIVLQYSRTLHQDSS